jgi:enoyl-CoA hydratase/carnithine racemase
VSGTVAGDEGHSQRWAPLVRVEIGVGIATVVLERPDAINAISTALATSLG